jgi:multidrug transporter EmrE-like cation transporter
MRIGLSLSLIAVNVLCILLSNVSFKWSAMSRDWKAVLRWQLVGNIAGFTGVLSLTALLRFMPLHQASGITIGLGFVLVQVIGGHLIFHEPVSRAGWTGAGLIAAGIALVCWAKST